jgi:hypothetical protein
MSRKTQPRSRAKKTKAANSRLKEGRARSIADAPSVLVIPGSRKKRFVLCVGSQRVAFDFTTQITELAPPQVIELPNVQVRKEVSSSTRPERARFRVITGLGPVERKADKAREFRQFSSPDS